MTINNPDDLDVTERDLLESFEADEWRPVATPESRAHYRDIARNTLRKDRRVNIRLSTRDLEQLQKRALEEGIPYQTLIASVLHKYVTGRLAERGA